MKFYLMFLALSLVLLTGLGCGNFKPRVDNSQDPDRYALDVKTMTLDHIQLASKSREPADEIQAIIDELEQTDRPRGNYAETYDQMLTLSRTLHEDCTRADGRPTTLNNHLTRLKQLALSLPGEVDTSTEPRD